MKSTMLSRSLIFGGAGIIPTGFVQGDSTKSSIPDSQSTTVYYNARSPDATRGSLAIKGTYHLLDIATASAASKFRQADVRQTTDESRHTSQNAEYNRTPWGKQVRQRRN